MFAHPLRIVFSCLLLTTASTALAQVQQNQPQDQATAEMRCGGQYECVEERLLTPAEARMSIAYPADAADGALPLTGQWRDDEVDRGGAEDAASGEGRVVGHAGLVCPPAKGLCPLLRTSVARSTYFATSATVAQSAT